MSLEGETATAPALQLGYEPNKARGTCPVCHGRIQCVRGGFQNTQWVMPAHQLVGAKADCIGSGQPATDVYNPGYI